MKTAPKIKSVRDFEPGKDEGCIFSIQLVGGKNDGEKFYIVEAELSDGAKRRLFASTARAGYFKQVFVPWDFEHPKLLDLR